jgi:hypothetical protein
MLRLTPVEMTKSTFAFSGEESHRSLGAEERRGNFTFFNSPAATRPQ